ncbi:hypothetical protein JHD50_11995 [Sulfurimonas sp. MAG313]|nr:hypothetical protein [Sulfurimonas sp. MAG313]MDF1882011.1 hypothetical protein [Sulfurimonas sp. MAG313]
MKHILWGILLLLLSACSDKKPGVIPPSPIWPMEFYEKFNLRTIVSSYGNILKYACESYPKDFFTSDQLYMPNTSTIVIYDLNRTLTFEITSLSQVIVKDQMNDSYEAEHLYTIYYNEEHNDYRTDLFFIKKKKNCLYLGRKKDANVSK